MPSEIAYKLPPLHKNLEWVLRVFISSGERFYWANGFSAAAALAYSSLLSLVPVTFVIFGFIASLAIGNEELQKVREFLFRQFIPNQQTVEIVLAKIAEIQLSINTSNFSLMAICFFAITAILLVNSIEYALNEIWQVFEPRSISQRITIFCAILVVSPILIVSAYYTAKLRIEPFLMDLALLQSFSSSVTHFVSLLLDFLAFFALYILVPKAPVKVSSAIFGGLVTMILFNLAKFYFTVYLVNFTSYDKIYGALAVIPIFLFWLYVTWTIILFGAQCSYQFQHLPIGGQIWRKQVTSVGDGALTLACQTLVLVGRSFLSGTRPPNETELAESLGVSSMVLKPILVKLKVAGILARSDTREAPLLLAKSPDRIAINDLLAIQGFHPRSPESVKSVSHFFEYLSGQPVLSTGGTNRVDSTESPVLYLKDIL